MDLLYRQIDDLDDIAYDTMEYVDAMAELYSYLSREDVYAVAQNRPAIWLEGLITDVLADFRRHILYENPNIEGLTQERISNVVEMADNVLSMYMEALYQAREREEAQAQNQEVQAQAQAQEEDIVGWV